MAAGGLLAAVAILLPAWDCRSHDCFGIVLFMTNIPKFSPPSDGKQEGDSAKA